MTSMTRREIDTREVVIRWSTEPQTEMPALIAIGGVYDNLVDEDFDNMILYWYEDEADYLCDFWNSDKPSDNDFEIIEEVRRFRMDKTTGKEVRL